MRFLRRRGSPQEESLCPREKRQGFRVSIKVPQPFTYPYSSSQTRLFRISIRLSTHPSIIHLFIYPFTNHCKRDPPNHLPLHPPTHPPTYLFIYLLITQPTHLYTYPSIYPIHSPIHLPIHLPHRPIQKKTAYSSIHML